jgi:hypothetical protein
MPIARADIKFGLYSDFLDRTLAAEEERLPGESIEDGVIRVHDALERAAAILKKRVQQGNGPEPVRSFTPQQTGPSVIETIDYKQKESLEIAIDNATSLESLAEIKEACGKAGLVSQYMKRLNELIVK